MTWSPARPRPTMFELRFDLPDDMFAHCFPGMYMSVVWHAERNQWEVVANPINFRAYLSLPLDTDPETIQLRATGSVLSYLNNLRSGLECAAGV